MEIPFPAYTGDAPFVFVCYSHDDAGVVYPEIAWLQEQGINVWYDEGISAGKNWRAVIGDSLLRASHVVFYISKNSLASEHCNREINLALDENLDIVPVYLDDVELTLDLKVGLTRVHALHRGDSWQYRDRLLQTLRPMESGAASAAAAPPTRSANTPSVRRSAYRWIAGIAAMVVIATFWMWQHSADPLPKQVTAPGPIETERSIAVLPFANMNHDPDQEFFSDGISEDLLNELAKSPDLIVRPRSSSFRFKGSTEDSQSIGRQLNVTHVVEGTVRKSGERVRVSVHLIDVATNRSIWTQGYERKLIDVFEVQDDITGKILTALDAQLGSQRELRKFASTEAYEAFLRGRFALRRTNVADAENWLEKAVALDPGSADAWALRAQVNAWQSANEVRPNGGRHLQLRRDYVNKALSIDPGNEVALATRALMDTHYVNRDYQAAVDELVRLAGLHPNNEDVLIDLNFVLGTIGRADLVDRVTAQAVKIAPLSATAATARIAGLLLFGTADEVREAMDELPHTGFYQPVLSTQLALADRDIEALRTAIPNVNPRLPIAAVYAALLPYLDGDFERAREIVSPLKRAEGYLSFRIKSYIALLEQDLDAAFALYRKGIGAGEQHSISRVQGDIGWRRTFPEFFADPRYAQMLEDFKLDPRSTAKIQVPDLPF